jgi:hypothetical protein
MQPTLGYSFLTEEAAMFRRLTIFVFLFAIAISPSFAAFQAAPIDRGGPDTLAAPKVLAAAEAAKILPDAVFFRGQSAAIQARNSGGVRFAKDALFLVALVDTSGYSSSVQEKYQAYLITETPIEIGGHRLEPGAYGCGFIAGENFIVMDIGGNDLFTVRSPKDAELRRPTPLQVLSSSTGEGYRLYVGRNYVTVAQAAHRKD